MGKIGACVVIYGSRGSAIADALKRSMVHDVDLYIADKNNNPFNRSMAKHHVVIPDLNVNDIADFVGENKEKINFVIPGSEGPIIDGLNNIVYEKYEIPVLCPAKEYAIEASKVAQRELIGRVRPEANPRYMVFRQRRPKHHVKDEFMNWIDELNCEVAIKPDKPGFGKGVGVWGDHFDNPEAAWEHFRSIYEAGDSVIVEEKVDGEEFSLQYFSDGVDTFATPAVRDYKRRFDGDKGKNTGGMGSYMGPEFHLPFMTSADFNIGDSVSKAIFKELRKGAGPLDLMGMPMYMAFICTKDGVKVLEINSRPGDPEIMNVLPVIDQDFATLCLDMADNNLNDITFNAMASVVTYGVPPTYGGGPEREFSKELDFSEAFEYASKHPNEVFIYPGSVKEDEMGSSRTVAAVATGDTIGRARKKSRYALGRVKGELDNRYDVGSSIYIGNSKLHMQRLRSPHG